LIFCAQLIRKYWLTSELSAFVLKSSNILEFVK
jgi:hypothetical protein